MYNNFNDKNYSNVNYNFLNNNNNYLLSSKKNATDYIQEKKNKPQINNNSQITPKNYYKPMIFNHFLNLNEIKTNTFSINANITGREKILKLGSKLASNFHEWIDLKILVWNVRSFTQDFENRSTKVNAVKKLTLKLQPDIVWLNDAQYNNAIYDINFMKYFDNRNLLLIRNEINEKVCIINEYMTTIERLNLLFVYFPPNIENNTLNQLIVQLESFVIKNFCIIGDMNLLSNNKIVTMLQKNNAMNGNIFGEPSLQLVCVKKPKKIKLFPAPSDHLFMYLEIEKQVNFSSFLKLTRIENRESNAYKYIETLFYGIEPKIQIGFRKKKANILINDYSQIINFITYQFLQNNSGPLYKRFRFIWSKYKREPFMGTVLSEDIITSWKVHLGHKDNKTPKLFDMVNLKLIPDEYLDNLELKALEREAKYQDITNSDIKVCLNLQQTYSDAINFDLLGLSEIYENVVSLIYNKSRPRLPEDPNFNKNRLKRFLNNAAENLGKINNNRSINNQELAKTFFLKKNDIIKSYADLRMIVISPPMIKVVETLVYKQIQQSLGKIINKEFMYQFGGIEGGSTYDAMMCLRYRTKKYKSYGVIFSDIAEGYDNINFELLEKFILEDKEIEPRMKDIMKLWITLVYNINYQISGKNIYRTKGIPMGLACSPIIFVYYVHKCINSYKYLSDLIMYIDDLALIIRQGERTVDIEKKMNELVKLLAIGGMKLKWKKTHTIGMTNTPILKGIKHEKKTTFLGVEIFHEKFIERNYDSFIEIDKNRIKCVPKWISIAMKRILYLGAFSAKIRFENYMFSCKGLYMVKHLQKCRQFFLSSLEKLSFVQLMFIINNQFMELLDPLLWDNKRDELIDKYKLDKVKINDIKKRRVTNNTNIKCRTSVSKFDKSKLKRLKEGKININKKFKDDLLKEQNELEENNTAVFSIINEYKNKGNTNLRKRTRLTISIMNMYEKSDMYEADNIIPDKTIEDVNANINKLLWDNVLNKLKLKLYRKNEIDLWNNAIDSMKSKFKWKIEKGFFFYKEQEIWNINKLMVYNMWTEFKEILLNGWIEKKKKEYSSGKIKKEYFKIKFEKMKEFMLNSVLSNKYSVLLDLSFGHVDWIEISNVNSYRKNKLFYIMFHAINIIANYSINSIDKKNELPVNCVNWIERINIFKIWKEIRPKIIENNKSNIFKVNKINVKDIEDKTYLMFEYLIKFEKLKESERGEKKETWKKIWGLVRFILLVIDMMWTKDLFNDKNVDEILYEIWNLSNDFREEKNELFLCEDIDDIMECEVKEILDLNEKFNNELDENFMLC